MREAFTIGAMSVTPHNPGQSPLVFFKVGLLGSAPNSFPYELAQSIGAHLTSSGAVLAKVQERFWVAGEGQPHVNRDKMRLKMGDDVRQALRKREGHVVVNKFYNSTKTRRELGKIAHAHTSRTVALNLHTSLEAAQERMQRWTAEDHSESIGHSLSDADSQRLLEQMVTNVSMARIGEEGLDFVFDLEGEATTPELIDQVRDYMRDDGLIERLV